MLTIKEPLNLDIELIKNTLPNIDLSKTLLVDIETTGFSSTKNIIYIIGCIRFQDEQAEFIQYICENEPDEYELLFEFSKLIETTKTFIHYNGRSFDVPFIKKRLKLFMLKTNIDEISEIDVYVDARHVKKHLPLDNLKLKTVENYYNYNRSDEFDGGQLIQVFKDFAKTKSTHLLEDLKGHNKEDLIGLYETLNLYYMINILNADIDKLIANSTLMNHSTDTEYKLILNYPCSFIHQIKENDWQINFSPTSIHIQTDIVHSTLKYYFSNYKDYYYLPVEKKVVHKSLASFVDSNYKERATKENCYTELTSSFIPYVNVSGIDSKVFYNDLNSQKYMELDENIPFTTTVFKAVYNKLTRTIR